jgi:hypothetical protein
MYKKMRKNETEMKGCVEKLRKLEDEIQHALQCVDVNEIAHLRLKIKQQNEKLRTIRRTNS